MSLARERIEAAGLATAVPQFGALAQVQDKLTPGGGDLLAGVPVTLTALATLARPAAWQSFTRSGTGAYSLTPAAWEELRQAGAAVGPVPPGA